MIDIHTHILPGVDDGAEDLAASVALARSASADGIDTIVATPHVRDDYPTSAGAMERLVEAVGAELERQGVQVRVLPGAEIALPELARLDETELRRLSLGGTGRYVLVEFPYVGWPLPMQGQIDRLTAIGMRAVIAHPERNADVQETPAKIRSLVEGGALVQLTAASLDGRLGRPSRRAAKDLLDAGLAHVVASDAHGPILRAAGMTGAAEAVGDPALARWLTRDVPGAVIAGEEPPPRPSGRRRWRMGRRD